MRKHAIDMTGWSEYEQKLAKGLESQWGRDWWLKGAHPQTREDYIRATEDHQRASAVRQMARDTVNMAASVLQAAWGQGLVEPVPGV